MDQLYEYEKYATDITHARQTLDKYGVAIIPNVLNEQECADMLAGTWTYLEHITSAWDQPINRSDPSTYSQYPSIASFGAMLMHRWNIGHAQYLWDLRQNEKIINIFAELLDTKPSELLVSFDGASFNIPPEILKFGWDTPSDKPRSLHHVDQSYTNNDFDCYQSWVTALDVNPGDATLSFMEGSHKYHGDFAEDFKATSPSNFYQLDESEEDYYVEKGCKYKKIKCPRGSLVLWDSRTVHRGANVMVGRAVPNFRCIAYLCYDRRARCTSFYFARKQKAFNEMVTTSHQPCKPRNFDTRPNNKKPDLNIMTPIDPPQLTDRGRRLAGF
jgi:hypothetical protein